jgi:GntR family transcriptional regulator, transcriptional repressor for pyruvate dehydrogenase complex
VTTGDRQPTPVWQDLPFSQASVADSLAAVLENLIVKGRIAPGTRLPPERELAALVGISRGSLREAIHELKLKGLVDRAPGRGTVVRHPFDGMPGGLLLGGEDDHYRAIGAIMDLRESIEPAIASKAAARATAADLQRLQELLRLMETELSPTATAQLDADFHEAVAASSHNPLLIRLHRESAIWMAQARAVTHQSKERRRLSLMGHREIFDAMRRHDPETAALAALRHVQAVARLLLEHPRAGGRKSR